MIQLKGVQLNLKVGFKLIIPRQKDLIFKTKKEVYFENRRKQKTQNLETKFYLLSFVRISPSRRSFGFFLSTEKNLYSTSYSSPSKIFHLVVSESRGWKNLQERLENKFCPMLAGSLQTLNKFTLKLGLPRHKGGYCCSLGQFDEVLLPVTKIRICMNYSRRRRSNFKPFRRRCFQFDSFIDHKQYTFQIVGNFIWPFFINSM